MPWTVGLDTELMFQRIREDISLGIILPIAVGLFVSWLAIEYMRELRYDRERRRALAERLRREGRE